MRTLPLYPGYQPTAALVETEEPRDRDVWAVAGARQQGRACTLCALGSREGLRSPCLAAEGTPGGLLVVGEAPGQDEDATGRPFYGSGGALLRRVVKAHWSGPVAFDSALRCFPKRGLKLTEKMVNACRGYLAGTLAEVRPTRIVAVGTWAAVALFGRSVPPLSSRGAYAWLRNGETPVPVWFVLPPAAAQRNRFIKQWFAADLAHALTAPNPPPGPWSAEATVISNEKTALYAAKILRGQAWVSFDVEATGTMWNDDYEIISVALVGANEDDAWVWDMAALQNTATRAVLLGLLTDKKLPKVGQNVKYDQLAFRAKYGVRVAPITIDTRLQRKLIDPEADGKLSKMAELVGMGGHKEENERQQKLLVSEVKKRLRKQWREKKPVPLDAEDAIVAGTTFLPHIDRALRAATATNLEDVVDAHRFGLVPQEVLLRYNALDALSTKHLALHLGEEIKKVPEFVRTWNKLVLPAARALERVEGWGVGASVDAIDMFENYLTAEEVKTKAVLDGFAPGVNWNSDDQVRDVLFKKLGLTFNKDMLTEGGTTGNVKVSVSKEALEWIAEKNNHPLPQALIAYNWVSHLNSTYAKGLRAHVRKDGRIHCNIKLDGARSGRTSATDPNLQNIPRAQKKEGVMARNCFAAPQGKKLVELDYSQLELRVACLLSGDPRMLEIFQSGIDYHLRTAQLVSQIAWGIPPEKVTDEERSKAKNVNFGVAYGKTAGTFAKEWGISRTKAQQIVDAIMGNFKDLQRWIDQRLMEAMRTGYVWTMWEGERARRRPLFRVADADDRSASVAKNGSRNSPVQGTASDYLIASLAESVQWIEQDGIEDDVKLCLAVHDSLLFEVSDRMVPEVVGTVTEIMEGKDSGSVPLKADCKVGQSWGSMSKWDEKTWKA